MAQQEERLSLGQYLQTLRVKKGLEFDEVCRKTHVSKQNLVYIETDDFDRLPAQVHVKGFLKAYAELLGLNPDRVLARYSEELMSRKRSKGGYGLSRRFDFWVRFLLAISALSAVIVLTLYSAVRLDRSSGPILSQVGRASEPQSQIPDTNGSIPTDATMAVPGETSTSETLKLTVIATEPTQFKVIVDGQIPKIYQLGPEDRLDLEAISNFNILTDNASGVALYFNEKPVMLSGKPGQNVTLQLP